MCGDKFGYEDLKLDEIDPLLFVFAEVDEDEELAAMYPEYWDESQEEDPIGYYLDHMPEEEIERRIREFQGPNYQPPQEDEEDEDEEEF